MTTRKSKLTPPKVNISYPDMTETPLGAQERAFDKSEIKKQKKYNSEAEARQRGRAQK